ncbi:MAG TPA: type I restriction endonuclease [Candidatus Kapabacteria bacterium]|nr:type I restriction endonuclease [Candidatus Kapabacteria bacterium]
MDFKDQLKQISDKIARMKDNVLTEEATKNAFVLPFIQCLGYDVFDPSEVVPEFICDIPTKKGEKIDFAIFMEGKPMILIECKHWASDLNLHDGQLLRYYTVSKARLGILTNGITYRFYTDLVSLNVMDDKPFFEIRIDDLKEQQIEKLKEFQKGVFSLETILSTASELKYTNELRNIILQEIHDPSDDFTRYFTRSVYPSSKQITTKVLEQFKPLVKDAFAQYINDTISERLKSVLNKQQQEEKAKVVAEQQSHDGEEVPLRETPDEAESFMIVKAICRAKVESSRIQFRNSHSYFSILLDDNNRKPICRLHFKGGKMHIGTFDGDKNETRFAIEALDDIYKHGDQFLKAIQHYDTVGHDHALENENASI